MHSKAKYTTVSIAGDNGHLCGVLLLLVIKGDERSMHDDEGDDRRNGR